MNARQKAKQLKKELDLYKKLPMPKVEIYNTEVKTYMAKRTVATELLHEKLINDEDTITYIKNGMIHELAKAISNDIEFKIESSYFPCNTDIVGKIAIATRSK